MLSKFLNVFVIAVSILVFPAKGNSQTVMVYSEPDDSGFSCYMEVFEYDFVPEKPDFPGGEQKLTEFINENREYPDEAYRMGIEGRVTCWFVVNCDGSISNVNLLRSADALLNQEAIRIFNLMPDWTPGRIDGIPVPVRVVRSIRFSR